MSTPSLERAGFLLVYGIGAEIMHGCHRLHGLLENSLVERQADVASSKGRQLHRRICFLC